MKNSHTNPLALDGDAAHLAAIERRGDEIRAGLPLSPHSVPRALSDIEDFQKIISPDYQRFAASQISENLERDLAYASTFINAPTLPAGLMQKLAELVSLEGAMVSAKEARKASEMAAMMSAPDFQCRVTENDGLLDQGSPGVAVIAGTHAGPIVVFSGGHVSQKTGRDSDNVVWHDISKLRGPTPKPGQLVDIVYAAGVGTVSIKALNTELGR